MKCEGSEILEYLKISKLTGPQFHGCRWKAQDSWVRGGSLWHTGMTVANLLVIVVPVPDPQDPQGSMEKAV